MTGSWSEIYRLWKTSRGGFSLSAPRTVLRRAEGWGCSVILLQEQGPLCLKQDMGCDQRALLDPTVPTRRKHPQLLYPETPQPAKTSAQFRILMFKEPSCLGWDLLGPQLLAWSFGFGAVHVVLSFPLSAASTGPWIFPCLNVAVGFLEC